MEIVNQQERYEEEEMERRFQENQKIGQVNDFRFKELVNEAIRYYETGYEKDNFWDLKSDELNDYPFYFPN